VRMQARARGRGLQKLEREDGRPIGSLARGQRRKGVEVGGVRARARAGDRQELEREARRRSSGRLARVRELEGRRLSGNRGGRRGLRCEREAGRSSRGRPAVAREGGWWEGGRLGERRCAAREDRRELEIEHGRPPSRRGRVRF
jgi:hypothetical protein